MATVYDNIPVYVGKRDDHDGVSVEDGSGYFLYGSRCSVNHSVSTSKVKRLGGLGGSCTASSSKNGITSAGDDKCQIEIEFFLLNTSGEFDPPYPSGEYGHNHAYSFLFDSLVKTGSNSIPASGLLRADDEDIYMSYYTGYTGLYGATTGWVSGNFTGVYDHDETGWLTGITGSWLTGITGERTGTYTGAWVEYYSGWITGKYSGFYEHPYLDAFYSGSGWLTGITGERTGIFSGGIADYYIQPRYPSSTGFHLTTGSLTGITGEITGTWTQDFITGWISGVSGSTGWHTGWYSGLTGYAPTGIDRELFSWNSGIVSGSGECNYSWNSGCFSGLVLGYMDISGAKRSGLYNNDACRTNIYLVPPVTGYLTGITGELLTGTGVGGVETGLYTGGLPYWYNSYIHNEQDFAGSIICTGRPTIQEGMQFISNYINEGPVYTTGITGSVEDNMTGLFLYNRNTGVSGDLTGLGGAVTGIYTGDYTGCEDMAWQRYEAILSDDSRSVVFKARLNEYWSGSDTNGFELGYTNDFYFTGTGLTGVPVTTGGIDIEPIPEDERVLEWTGVGGVVTGWSLEEGNGTGEYSFPIRIGGTIYKRCFLDDYSLTVRPFEPVKIKARFSCMDFPTDSEFRANNKKFKDYYSDNMSSNDVVYSYTSSISGISGEILNDELVTNFNYDKRYNRSIVKALGGSKCKDGGRSVVDDVELSVNIESTGFKSFMSLGGSNTDEDIAFTPKDVRGGRMVNKKSMLDFVIPSGTLIVNQQYSADGGGHVVAKIDLKHVF